MAWDAQWQIRYALPNTHFADLFGSLWFPIPLSFIPHLRRIISQYGVAKQEMSNTAGRLNCEGKKVIAGIPAYNEAEGIVEVIQKALPHVDEVIVADDGSIDDTARVAQTAGATVVRSKLNQGAGNATRLCFQIARDRNADVLITIDADGQHNAEEIPSVVAPIFDQGADLVIGSRFIEYAGEIPRYRRFGIRIITLLLNLAFKVKISDSQSCFRAYSKRAIENLNITEKGFGFSIETLVQARRQGLVIKEVPISCVYNEHSHSLNPLVHGLQIALSVVRLRLK